MYAVFVNEGWHVSECTGSLQEKARYDEIAETLKVLQAEKKELQGRIIMDTFMKSGKSMDELMIFLGSGRK